MANVSLSVYRNLMPYTGYNSVSPTKAVDTNLLKLGNQYKSLKQSAQNQFANYRAEQQSYASQIKEVSSANQQLKSATGQFSGAENVFAKNTVTSTSSAISGQAKVAAKAATYEVEVSKVATAQQNTGTRVNALGYGALSAGNYTLGVTDSSGKEKNISFAVSAGENNSKVLEKVAKAFSESGLNINAVMSSDGTKTGLNLQSKETGAAQSFTLRDVSGNAVAALGLGNRTQQAENAVYSVNGKAATSASNQISLDYGNVTLNLQKATTEKAVVTVGKNPAGIVTAAKEMITAYNRLETAVTGADNVTAAGQRVFSRVDAKFQGYQKNELANIGITRDSQTGELALDEKRLTSALAKDSGRVQRLLGGENGLTGALNAVSSAVGSSPASTLLKVPSPLESTSSYGQTGSLAVAALRQSSGFLLDLFA
ncbi:flagellar filament capping protein FliD [Anaeromusa acidaminophila]|uniref:flagellar filament capping protein FliD n=1 Tax=Anaeromusa acidaminophila TaxID=81464 RepID=UPI00037794B6|nr:flagellar filament capping protein FliD [Anaeromusa acidaminophila]